MASSAPAASASAAAAPHVERTEVAPGLMRIYVRDPAGATLNLDIASNGSESIGAVKQQLRTQHGVDFDRVRLFMSGKPLEEQHTVADYNIGHDVTLHLLAR